MSKGGYNCWYVPCFTAWTIYDGWGPFLYEFSRQMAELAKYRDSGAVEISPSKDGADRIRQSCVNPRFSWIISIAVDEGRNVDRLMAAILAAVPATVAAIADTLCNRCPDPSGQPRVEWKWSGGRMNIFQLVKSVLDEQYAAIRGQKRKRRRNSQGAGYLGQCYARLGKEECKIDYADPGSIRVHLSVRDAHADYVCSLLARRFSRTCWVLKVERLLHRWRSGQRFGRILKCVEKAGRSRRFGSRA